MLFIFMHRVQRVIMMMVMRQASGTTRWPSPIFFRMLIPFLCMSRWPITSDKVPIRMMMLQAMMTVEMILA